MSLSNFKLTSLKDKLEAEAKQLEEEASKSQDTQDKPRKGKTVDVKKDNK